MSAMCSLGVVEKIYMYVLVEFGTFVSYLPGRMLIDGIAQALDEPAAHVRVSQRRKSIHCGHGPYHINVLTRRLRGDINLKLKMKNTKGKLNIKTRA